MRTIRNQDNVSLITIYEIGKILSSSLELHKTLRQVLNVIAAHLSMQRGTVYLQDDSGDMVIAAAIGLEQEEIHRGRYKVGEGVTG
jgi:Nif-specific regulatory protein